MKMPYKKEDAAERYDAARALPEQTLLLWMDSLRKSLPEVTITSILDLGAGTGRFAESLRDTFKCPVIAVDPSEAMLAKGRNRKLDNIVWECGSAEDIPIEADSVDLVWMSQVFHHLKKPQAALLEIRRVLRPAGYLIIRNGTRENNEELTWIHCFPEAQKIEEAISPSRNDILNSVCKAGFDNIAVQTVNQIFAYSYTEYYDKISQRGLSTLISISDDAFKAGLRRLKEWTSNQPQDRPVYEPVDLFVFRMNN